MRLSKGVLNRCGVIRLAIVSAILGPVLVTFGGLTRNKKPWDMGTKIAFVAVILWGIVMLYILGWFFVHRLSQGGGPAGNLINARGSRQVAQTPSAFDPHTQRNVDRRRDARVQRTSTAISPKLVIKS